jgi:putative thioredoxin
MLDITLKNFEADVVKASTSHPVLLDIWAPWCGPCKSLGPVLEKLETEYAGRFGLAKLNSDDQPEIAGQLSQMFGVRSIPFCVLFKDGQPVDGFVGALPEGEVRQFLDNHVPSVAQAIAQEDTAEAAELLAEGDADQAIEKLQEAVALDPSNDGARADYVGALLFAGRWEEARAAFVPAASRAALDARLSACGHWLNAHETAESGRGVDELRAAIAANKRDFDARFELAQRHFAKAEFTQAMDELLEILMRDKTWGNEKARKTYVAILEVAEKSLAAESPRSHERDGALRERLELPGSPAPRADQLTDRYRRKLSMALF